jgi:anti-sigma regulatory factor (Ser/Thr protein kinase)
MTADEASVSAACAWLEAQCAANGLAFELGARIGIVAEEVLSNVAKYGGKPPATVEIGFTCAGVAVEVEIADDGPAFDPTAAPSPVLSDDVEERAVGGLGLLLVAEMMDEVVYRHDGERNRLVLRKRING